jgi:hypothetical protein
MDWETLYCPNKHCRYYGLPFRQGQLVKNGHSHGQTQALCKSGGGRVALSYATAYYGLESEPAIFEAAIRAVVFGTPESVAAHLAASAASRTINTSFVERDNLSQRQPNRRLARQTNAFSKDIAWLEKQLWLSTAYYHFVLPHLSLRQPLASPKATRGTGSSMRWKPVTPAMAAGITDHVWTTSCRRRKSRFDNRSFSGC